MNWTTAGSDGIRHCEKNDKVLNFRLKLFCLSRFWNARQSAYSSTERFCDTASTVRKY